MAHIPMGSGKADWNLKCRQMGDEGMLEFSSLNKSRVPTESCSLDGDDVTFFQKDELKVTYKTKH